MTDKKSEIYKIGKELFEANGFKDTNVAKVMSLTGFATGTFYNYYKSKDQLFMEIFNDENILLKKSIIESVDTLAAPIAVIKEIVYKNLQGMRTNPILREWYNKDVFSKIEERFREDNCLANVDFLYDYYIDIVSRWQKEGRMRNDISAEMIMGMFGALINIDLHKDEIGIELFPEIMDHLACFIMNGLQPSAEDVKDIISDERW